MAWLLLSSFLAFTPLIPTVQAATSPSIDGTTESGTWTTGTSFTVTTVTASSGDVIIVFVVTYKSASSITVSSLPAVTGVTWQSSARESAVSCSTDTQETTETEWYGVTTAALSSATITIDLSGTPTHAIAYVISIKGAAISSPFDPNSAALVAGASACSTTKAAPTASSQSTTDPNDLLIQFMGAYTSVTETAGSIDSSTATLNKATAETDYSIAFQYLSVSSTVSSGSCAFGTTTTYWETFCDAVTANYASTVSPSMSLSATVNQALAATTSAALSLSASVSKGTAEAESASMGLAPTLSVQAALSALDSSSMSLSPSLGQTLVGATQSASLALSSAVGGALTSGVSASLSLAPSVNQAIDGIAQSLSLALSPVLSTLLAFTQTLSASISLAPSVGQGLAGLTQTASVALSPSVAALEAFFATLTASLSLYPTVDQDLAGVAGDASVSLSSAVGQGLGGLTQSLSVALSPSLSGIAAFLATLTASVSLAPAVDQDLAGLTSSVTVSLSPVLTAALAFFATLTASVSLVPSLDQDIGGVASSLSVSLSSSLDQDLAGVTSSVSTTLTPTLAGAAAFLASLSANLSLSPSLEQDIAGMAQSASVSLTAGLSSLAAMAESLSASVSLAPSLGQGVSGVTNTLSVALSSTVDQDVGGVALAAATTLASSLGAVAAFAATLSQDIALAPGVDQGLAGLTDSVSVALSPTVAGLAAFVSSLFASIALSPSAGEGLSGITQSVSASISASVEQGLGGITEAAGVTITPLLAGMVAFFESVLGMTTLSPSLSVATSLAEEAPMALAPSLLAVVNVPPKATTAISCSPAVLAEGLSAKCTVEVSGVSPTGTVAFSSTSGTFSPLSCALASGACYVTFLAPVSPGTYTVNATYSGDAENSASWGTFTMSVPAFSLSPSSGPVGTSMALAGSGFAAGAVYDYCFEPGVTSEAGPSACPSTQQFAATSSGTVPGSTVLVPAGQTGLVVVTDTAGVVVAYEQATISPSTTHASIALSPTSGSTGTPIAVTGAGFTPGATVTITYTNGTVTTDPAVVTVSSGGSFTASFAAPSSRSGSNLVAAIGSDPGDSASATFTATNVGSYQTASISVSAGGTATVNGAASTGVSLTISSPSGASGTVITNGLTEPSYGVSLPTFATAGSYFDVYVSGLPGTATVLLCFTGASVTSSSVMEYWNGGSWVVVASQVHGTTICNTGSGSGVVYVSELTATNFAVGVPPSGGGGGVGPIYVAQSIRLTEGTGNGPIPFELSGCGVIPSVIQGDAVAHHIAAYPDCTVSVTPIAPSSATTRYVFQGGNGTLDVATCGGLGCSSSLNATYYTQILQNFSFTVVGGGSGYGAPSVTAHRFGSPYTFTLASSPTSYWLDANGNLSPPRLLPGSGQSERWSLVPSEGGLSAEVSNSEVLVYSLQYPVVVTLSPSGSGTTSPAGEGWYNASSTITVSAIPNLGYRFTGWSSATGNVTLADTTSPTTSATVGGSDTLTALFAASTTTSTSSSTTTSKSSTSTFTSASSTLSSSSSATSTSTASTTTLQSSTTTSTRTTSTSTRVPQPSTFPTALLLMGVLLAAVAAAGLLAVRRRRKQR